MIKLNKLDEPEILKNRKADWTKDFVEAKAANRMTNTIKFRYRHPEIKSRLRSETNDKCAYCESKITHVCPGDIEHIVPHSEVPELVLHWENLTLACVECNRRKSTYLNHEEPLLNPYVDDPEQHLIAVGTFVFGRAGDARGKLTELLLELNRGELLERRFERINSLKNLAEVYASMDEGELKDLIRNQLIMEVSDDREYAFVARAFIKLYSGIAA